MRKADFGTRNKTRTIQQTPSRRVSARGGLAFPGICLLLSFALFSCGYGLSGKGLLVPEEARTIAIPPFLNNTYEPYVDSEVTRAVVGEFLADSRLKIVDLDAADLALKGKIVQYDVTALSYTPESYVQQYNVRLVVDAVLEDLRTGKTLWQEAGISAVFISDYPVTVGDIKATRIAKEAAIKKAAQDIAWTLRSRVLEGF